MGQKPPFCGQAGLARAEALQDGASVKRAPAGLGAPRKEQQLVSSPKSAGGGEGGGSAAAREEGG